MPIDVHNSVPCFFTQKGLIDSPESLQHAQAICCSVFEKRPDDQTVAHRLFINWLWLQDGRVIPTVAHPDLLPLMEEVLIALEATDV